MQYNQPADQPSNPNAPYVDGQPAAGIQGSIVPAAGVEFDQREVVEVITRANVRGYSDFSGTPCAVPANADLTQLRKAIEGFITDWEFIIDTEVTFTVHGPGAYFPDLITALNYLGKYRITPTGHVILRLAGSTSGVSEQFVYNQPIVFDHPNNDRISVLGAPMLKPVPLDDTGYASNGGASSAQRAADIQTNYAILRSCFATELVFASGCNAIWVWGLCIQHFDGILLSGFGNSGCNGIIFNCTGYLNAYFVDGQPTSNGIAAVAMEQGQGFLWDVGAGMSCSGWGTSATMSSPLIAIGCYYGMGIGDGGFMTSFSNLICLNNTSHGILYYPRSGCQQDGGLFSCSNGGDGVNCSYASSVFINGPLLNGTAIGPSHFYKNGGWGVNAYISPSVALYCDCGGGTGNANQSGSINAVYGSTVWARSSVGVSGSCSPAFGVVGNNNSIIAP